MSNSQAVQKTLEVKIRPYPTQIQEKGDFKGAARVYLSSDALLDLGLRPGQVCSLWRLNEAANERRDAIAWNTPEKSMGKKVVQMSRALQEACGFKLSEELKIAAAGDLGAVETLILRDVTAKESLDAEELGDEERKCWEWYLSDHLYRAEVVFPGMIFKNISIQGIKRSFKVDSVNGGPTDIGKFDKTSSVSINTSILESSRPNGTQHILEIDIAGIGKALEQLNDFLHDFSDPIQFSEDVEEDRECAVLIHGSRGTGKTYVIDKVINTGWAKKIIRIHEDTPPSLLPAIFRDAKLSSPTIIALDDFESLFTNEDKATRACKRTLGEELDRLGKEQRGSALGVLVIAATLDSSKIPAELKKFGRFRTEIGLPVPDAASRKAILRSCHPPFHPDLYEETLNKLGEQTHAYTAEDLKSLLMRTRRLARKRVRLSSSSPPDGPYFLTQEDIDHSLQQIRPTAMHDITLQPPPVHWDDIGGNAIVKKALRQAVETPLRHPQILKRLGIRPQKGALLYGPPGCSKTLIAQAMATSGNFNFFAVKGAELLNMYVGESERAIRNIFARAEAAKPAVIFFDEIDSIANSRESNKNGGIQVLATMLNCMDGIEALNGVFVLAATNRPDVLDSALLRPGRFDQSIYVPLPSLEDRAEILAVQARKMDFASDVDIEELARLTDGYSGAEIVKVCQKGGVRVAEKCIETGQELQITMEDLRYGLSESKKQITPKSLWIFEKFAAKD